MKEDKVFIYGLVDPELNQIRYIGKSKDPEERLRDHLKESKRRENYRHCWIYSLLSKNLKPQLTIIEECTEDNWEERERHWIKYYREKVGNLLTNMTDGGDGMHNPSEEVRRKIGKKNKGRKHTPEELKKMSEALKGERNPFYGRHHTEETKRKISEKKKGQPSPMKGKKFSEEHRRKLREARHRRQDPITFKTKNAKSKYFGLSWINRDKVWQVRIAYNKKRITIGYFKDEIEAAKAFDKKCWELYHNPKFLNFPEDYINKK